MESRLTLVEDRVGKTHDGHILARYACSCGATLTTSRSRVKNGYTLSCGCLAREVSSQKATTHGMRNSPEYSSWMAMKGRCLDPDNKDFPRWGAVGVTVCREWEASFEAFYAHVGPRPNGTSLDRIDGMRGYEPGNVRWATPQVQARNRRRVVTVDTPAGRMLLTDYADKIGISNGAAHLRLKRGKLEGVTRV